jgi:hypothetical protein
MMRAPNCLAFVLVVLALAACLSTGAAGATTSVSLDEKRRALAVVAYVPEYRTGIDWDFVAKRATDLVLFSVEPLSDGDVKPYFPIDDEGADSALVQAHRARNATRGMDHLPPVAADGGVRLLLCVGGGGRSESFAAVAASPRTRAVLVANLLQIVQTKQLQGIDFDWEVPMSRKQQTDYGLLLADAATAFHAHDPHLLVTVAIHAWQDLGTASYAAVDRVHLMSYDAQGGNGKDGHATYAQAKTDAKRLASYGCPMGKIALGLPFYGRGISNPSLVLTYSDLVSKVGADLDPTSDVLGKDSAIGFNNVLTVQKKTKWALTHGLAGIMVWEVGQDTTDAATSLMEAIYDTKMGIKKKGRFKKKPATSDPRFAKAHQKKAKRAAAAAKKEKKKKKKRRIKRNFDL